MKKYLLPALLVCLSWRAARAQTFEASVVGGMTRMGGAPLGSLNEGKPQDDDTRLKKGTGLGARFTWNTPGYYGHELGYIRSRATMTSRILAEDGKTATVKEDQITSQLAFYNFLIYFMPRGEWWRPFITGGLQLHQYGAPDFPEWPGGGSRNYGGNYGGGIKFKFFKHGLVRLDVRNYVGGKPYGLTFADPDKSGGYLRQLEATAGVSIGF